MSPQASLEGVPPGSVREEELDPLESLPRLRPDELLADRAYRELSRAIITRRIGPGALLNMPKLARQLDISRSPVREAVQRLIYDGLAEKRGRWTVVACAEREALKSLFQVRVLLDGLAARRAAVEATDEDIALLREILVRHRGYAAAGGLDETTQISLDLEFHAGIRDLVACKDLSALLVRVHNRCHLSYAADYSPQKIIDPLADHTAILDAIARRDPDGAEVAAQKHVLAVAESLGRDLRQSTEAAAGGFTGKLCGVKGTA